LVAFAVIGVVDFDMQSGGRLANLDSDLHWADCHGRYAVQQVVGDQFAGQQLHHIRVHLASPGAHDCLDHAAGQPCGLGGRGNHETGVSLRDHGDHHLSVDR
jgi:hypothetical protein